MNKNTLFAAVFAAFIFLFVGCDDDGYTTNKNTKPVDSTAQFYGGDNAPVCNQLIQKTPKKTCYLLWCASYKKAGLTTLYCEDN